MTAYFRTIDFETTGMPPDAAVCEIGACDVIDGSVQDPFGFLCNPGRPMPIEARAVHHISDADVAQAMPAAEGLAKILEADENVTAYVAHNVAFESEFLKIKKPWICTMKVARKLWPDCPSFKNQVVRYYLNIDDQQNFIQALSLPVHRAYADAYVTAHIFNQAQKLATIEDMIEWTRLPSLLIKVGFGKHKGQLWKDLPRDYLQWFLKQSEIDPDVRYTCEFHLKKKAA